MCSSDLYVPSAGAAWVLGTMMEGILAWAARDRSPASTGTIRRAAWTLSTLWVLGSASEAIRLMPIWRDDGTMFRAMTLIEPSNPRGWVGWSSWLGREGRDSEALRGLAIAESLDARYPELYVVRGKIQAQRDEWPLALASAQRALALDSLRRSASVLEVIALLHLGRFDEAEIRLRPMMAREPGEPRGESLWGQLLAARGRDAEALPYLTRAAQRLTDDAGLAFTLGMVQLKLYRPLEARRALEKAIELAPEFYDGWIRLATACLLSGDRTGCERALDRAATLPGARDGRVERLRAALAAAPR